MATVPPSYEDAIKNNYGTYPNQPPYPQQQYNLPYQPGSFNQPSQYPDNQPAFQVNVDYHPPIASTYQPGVPPVSGPTVNVEENSNFVSFSEKSVRAGFIRKVYLIMTAQLLVSTAFVCLFQFVKPVKTFVQHNVWFYFLSYGVFVVTYIILICVPRVRRNYPGNFICLSVFTLAFSYMVAAIASFHDIPAILAAVGITTVVCVGITIFAMQTKIDFTLCTGFILVFSLVLIFTGLACLIIAKVDPRSGMALQGLYAGLAIFVFGLYLVYDTQLIIGGRKYELSPEDYIEGALQLYLDIMMLFLIILSLFGSKN